MDRRGPLSPGPSQPLPEEVKVGASSSRGAVAPGGGGGSHGGWTPPIWRESSAGPRRPKPSGALCALPGESRARPPASALSTGGGVPAAVWHSRAWAWHSVEPCEAMPVDRTARLAGSGRGRGGTSVLFPRVCTGGRAGHAGPGATLVVAGLWLWNRTPEGRRAGALVMSLSSSFFNPHLRVFSHGFVEWKGGGKERNGIIGSFLRSLAGAGDQTCNRGTCP